MTLTFPRSIGRTDMKALSDAGIKLERAYTEGSIADLSNEIGEELIKRKLAIVAEKLATPKPAKFDKPAG